MRDLSSNDAMKLLFGIILVAVAFISPAHSDQIRFSGQTRADRLLLTDALRNVMLIAKGRFDCDTIDLVESEVLPPTFVPPNASHYPGWENAKYERWIVTLCGEKAPMLFAFWPAPEGGSMFRLQQPFPSIDNEP